MQQRTPTQVRGRHRRTDALHSDHVPTTAVTTPQPGPAQPGPAQPGPAQAYLDLLASTEPLTPAGLLHNPASSSSADLRAYRDLLASDAKLTPREGGRAIGHTPGPAGARAGARAGEPTPRRRDVHSHRAPGRPIAPALLGERGRYAVAAAAIAAGVGVAGVSAATAAVPGRADAVVTQARTQAAAHTALTPTTAPAPVPITTAASPAATAASPTTTAAAAGSGTAYTAADGTPTAEPIPGVASPALSGVRTARKARPVPVPVRVVEWVNPMPGGAMTSCYGQRWGRLHAGVDLAAAHGTPIRAAGAGTVVRAGAAQGYGNAVLIDHGNGYLTHYGHMSAITVIEGQRVEAGAQIGNEGSTGHSTGPHLHFEVHEGSYKNPIEPTAWMHEHGVDIPGCVSFAGDDHEHED